MKTDLQESLKKINETIATLERLNSGNADVRHAIIKLYSAQRGIEEALNKLYSEVKP